MFEYVMSKNMLQKNMCVFNIDQKEIKKQIEIISWLRIDPGSSACEPTPKRSFHLKKNPYQKIGLSLFIHTGRNFPISTRDGKSRFHWQQFFSLVYFVIEGDLITVCFWVILVTKKKRAFFFCANSEKWLFLPRWRVRKSPVVVRSPSPLQQILLRCLELKSDQRPRKLYL